MSHTLEKCMLAAKALATSDQPLRERIWDAYIHHLHVLREEALPEDARISFAHIGLSLGRVESQQDGSVRASLEAASDEEVRVIAKLLWHVIECVLVAATVHQGRA
jgi:hypothetical protein